MEDEQEPIRAEITQSVEMYLKICAHCNQCLDQIVADPNKFNVVLHYRDEKGDYVQWKPPTNQSYINNNEGKGE